MDIKKAVLIFILMLLPISGSTACFAQAFADDPTDFGGDARLYGMGQAYAAISNDPNAVFLNPAGLGGIKNLELTGMYYTRIFGTYYYLTGAGACPTPWGTFALGYVGSGIGGIVNTRDPGETDFGYSNNVFILSYGTPLVRFGVGPQRIYVGTSIKLFGRGYLGSVDDSGTGTNVDLGLKYVPFQWLSLGLSKSNILTSSMGGGIVWKSGYNESLASTTRLGAAMRAFEDKAVFGLDMRIPEEEEKPSLFSFGGEYQLNEAFSLRAGLSENIDAKSASRKVWDYSLGLGFKYQGLAINYAYRPYFSDQSNTSHFVSLSFTGDLEELLRIKVGSVKKTEPLSFNMDALPGKVYDDLGNVVRGARSHFTGGTGIPKTGSVMPVVFTQVDYERLLASVFVDMKYAKEEKAEHKYWPGDVLSVIVEAPYDTETVVSVMPNKDKLKLIYDAKAQVWYGVWRVPEGVPRGFYRAKATSTDYEGVDLFSESTKFFIESGVPARPETREAEVINISPEVKNVPPAPLPKPVKEEVKIREVSEYDAAVLIERILGKSIEGDRPLSRGAVTYIMAHLKGYDIKKAQRKPFADVSVNFWAAGEISACLKHKIVDGYPDQNFNPDRVMTLIELLCLVCEVENLRDPGPQLGGGYWAAGVLRAVRAAGIYGSSGEPTDPSTLRSKVNFAKIARILSRTKALKAKFASGNTGTVLFKGGTTII